MGPSLSAYEILAELTIVNELLQHGRRIFWMTKCTCHAEVLPAQVAGFAVFNGRAGGERSRYSAAMLEVLLAEYSKYVDVGGIISAMPKIGEGGCVVVLLAARRRRRWILVG